MATPEDFAAGKRARMLARHADGLLSDLELIGSLLDTFGECREAAELAATDTATRAAIRAFFGRFRPNPLPPAFVIGRAEPGYLERLYAERSRKYSALLAALNLSPGQG